MKRWLGLLVLLCLLCGCAPESQTSTDGNTLSTVMPTEQPEPGLYDPENRIEMQTGGAVRAYPLGSLTCRGLATMGSDLLLFGEDTLTLLAGENLTEAVTVTAENLPLPGSGMIQIHADGAAYYDSEKHEVVFLSAGLREYGRLRLSDVPTGGAYLTPDWKKLYYCTAEGVRVLDLDTGISRTLKAQETGRQSISGGFANGAVLRCDMTLTDGTERTILIDAQTGETLAEGDYLSSMTGAGDRYFLTKQSGSVKEWIFGQGENQTRNFWPGETDRLLSGEAWMTPLPESDAAVVMSASETGIRLNYYDLTTGYRSASLELEEFDGAYVLTAGNGMVWFCREGILYRWETALSAAGDETVYTAPHYTLEDADADGLQSFAQRVQALEKTYGVDILYWTEAADAVPGNYSFETEYLTQAYEAGFAALEAAMARFPEDFFRKAADWTKTGVLRIVLVRGIYGAPEQGTLDSVPGVQYLLNGDSYMALCLGEDLERNFYHQAAHAIDTKILSSCRVFYEWNTLNPAGFSYDNDYITNRNRQDWQYLEDGNRSFIDMFSMSFAAEDRARILEYACMPGNERYFTSKCMQTKLKRVCDGIRETFDLKGDGYLWEQYLMQ